MSNIPAKSIKFPGLDDTYTFLQNDTTLTQSGKAADAKVVGDKITELNSSTDNLEANCLVLPDVFTIDGYTLQTSGIPKTASGQKITDYIKVQAGDKIKYHMISGNGRAALYFYDTNKDPSSLIASGSGTSTFVDGEYTALADGYIRVNVISSAIGVSYFYIDGKVPESTKQYILSVQQTLNASIATVDAELSDFENNPAFIVIPDVYTIDGKTLNADGTAIDYTDGMITDYIPIKNGDKIVYNIKTGTGRAALYYYNTSKTPTTEIAHSSGDWISGSYTAEANGYIRASTLTANKGSSYFYFENRVLENTKKLVENVTTKYDAIVAANDQPYTYIPYVATEYADTLNKASAFAQLGNTVMFGFSTDQHISNVKPERTAPLRRGLMSLANLSTKLPMDFIALGGDYTDKTTVTDILGDVATIRSFVSGAECPVIPLTGNHDSYQNNNNITGAMVFNSYIKKLTYKSYWEEWDKTHASGVIDSAAHGIRYVFLDDTQRGDSYTLQNMKDKLADMMDNRPEGYKMVIFSHHPMRGWPDSYFTGGNLCNATMLSHADGDVICCINGHGHGDDSRYYSGVVYIETVKAYPVNNSDMEVDTVTETAFDIFDIDYTNHVIYAIRYGYGGDRTWHYSPVELSVGDTHTFTTSLTGTVTWSCDEWYVDADNRHDVATVSDGVITTTATGETLVKATDEDGNMEAWAISVT